MNFVATLVNYKILVAEQRQNGLVKAWAYGKNCILGNLVKVT